MILLDTDHINVLQAIGPRSAALTARLDLKIASIALSNGALLLSANLRDFEQVPHLRVEDWLG